MSKANIEPLPVPKRKARVREPLAKVVSYGRKQQAAHQYATSEIWSYVVPSLASLNTTPDPMTLIQNTRIGLPGDSVRRVAEILDLPLLEMYRLLNMTPKTGQRSVKAKLDPEKSDKIIKIVKTLKKAGEAFGDSQKALAWLRSPCYSLGGQIPLELLDTSEGYELVMDTLIRIEYGVPG